ncbi:hypothetical protein VDG1235_3653 [Verrucomicrobiia bacterium DG1235]|nr:hypothetical protein VDG1235_3653 [Verrucomicrobiae bacterium DG1235]
MDINMKNLRYIWVLAACAAGFLASVRADEIWLENRRTEIDLGDALDILVVVDSSEGDLKIVGEDRPSIEVIVDKFSSFDEDRNRAKVDVDFEEGIFRLKTFKDLKESDLTLLVPRSVSLRLRTRDGDIVISSIDREIELTAIDGDILLEDVSGGIVANTVDGDIRIELSNTKLVNPISLATVDGDVVMIAPKSLGATISASTIDGEFDSELSIQRRGKKGGFGGWVGVTVDGVIGEGGPSISLKTIDGDILIRVK